MDKSTHLKQNMVKALGKLASTEEEHPAFFGLRERRLLRGRATYSGILLELSS